MSGGEGWGSILGGIGAIASTAVNAEQSKKALAQQKKQFQQQMAYAKWVQEENWRRADTEVQRRASDMKLAGINPLMAGGMGGNQAGGMMAMPAGVDYVGANAAMMGNVNEGMGMIANALGGLDDRRLKKEEINNTSRMIDQDIQESGSRIQKNLSDMTVNAFQNMLTEAEIPVKIEEAKLLKQQFEQITADINKKNQEIANLKTQGEGYKIDNKIKYLSIEKEKAISSFFKTVNNIFGETKETLNSMGYSEAKPVSSMWNILMNKVKDWKDPGRKSRRMHNTKMVLDQLGGGGMFAIQKAMQGQ